MPRNLLAYTFWPDESEEAARLNLRRHVHRLHQILPAAPPDNPWVLSDRSSVQWYPDGECWLDIAEFEGLRRDPQRLPGAIDLYGGDLLEGLYDEWVFAERERLREL